MTSGTSGGRAFLERVAMKSIKPLLVIRGLGLRSGRWLPGMLLVLATCICARAVTPDEVLQDPKLEMRAREISQGLRCVVCQNQSIDDSNAPLAHDLRVLVRERLVSGDTNDQAVDFIVSRYGNFVLLNPPMHFNTLALWIGPALFVLMAAIAFGRYMRRRSEDHALETPSLLTAAEQRRVEQLLDERGST